MSNRVFELQTKGYRLTTAEILYHLPDHPSLLQSFVWQQYDLMPKFPVLTGFLHFWEKNLDGRLHSVKVAAAGIFQPVEFGFVDQQLVLH